MPCQCLICQLADALPEKAYVTRIREYMLTRKPRYTQQSVREVLDWIAEYGTVECCESLNDEDRTPIERLIPGAPLADWARYENERWECDDAGYPENCGCPDCQAEIAEHERAGAAIV